MARKLAVTEALSDLQKERDALAYELAQANPQSSTECSVVRQLTTHH